MKACCRQFPSIRAIFLILLGLSSTVQGEEKIADPAPDLRVIEGINLLYNWKFEQAERAFYQVTAERPHDPMGYFYLAMVSWSELASGFWSPDKVNQYGKRIDKAIDIARERIDSGDADAFAYFYLGGALGFKGRYRLMERRWLSAFFLAVDAIEALKTCQQMDPDNKDVLFGLGIFDYYTARLSGTLKFLTYLLLHKGDVEEGLRKLHAAADEAVYCSIESKSLLVHIYLFLENRPDKALPLAADLARRFRDNPRNRYFEGVAYILTGAQPAYENVLEGLRRRSAEQKTPRQVDLWTRRGSYLEASYHLFNGLTEKARAILSDLLDGSDPENDPFMVGWPLLKIGMSYDLEEKREKAVDYYRRVISMENGAGAQFLAEKYLENPVGERDPFLCY